MSPYHFLIADDLIDNRILLQEVIELLGHTYLSVENGKKAIEALEKENFDMIFMDIEMPVMNGMETTVYIRKKFFSPKREIPIIAISAHNPESFWDLFEGSGFSGFTAKPFSIEHIIELISTHLQKK